MLRGTPTVILLVALLGAALGLTAGCSKYDGLERNMQYVSDDLARKDAVLAWQQVTAAHAAWQKAGQSHDPADAAFAAYQDAYARYAVTYNELLERTNAPAVLPAGCAAPPTRCRRRRRACPCRLPRPRRPRPRTWGRPAAN